MYVPVIVLCQSESFLMQGSSCYSDSLSHSRSGRTISAQPAALSQSLPIMNTHMRTHTHIHTAGSGSPCLKAAGKIRSDWVHVCGSHLVYVWDGRGVCSGPALSSLHSSVLMEGYVKTQTCCCSLQAAIWANGRMCLHHTASTLELSGSPVCAWMLSSEKPYHF